MSLSRLLPLGFALYMGALLLWLAPITLAPFLQAQGSPAAELIYPIYGSSLVCHQLNSRSLCYFPANNTISDCTEDSARLEYAKTNSVALGGAVGYKFPVCARDIGIYYAMLLGGAIMLLAGLSGSKAVPSPWFLVAALIPMAIDGTTQALGWRESSNSLRIWTGFLVGIALPFYFVPMLNSALPGIFRRHSAPQHSKKEQNQ